MSKGTAGKGQRARGKGETATTTADGKHWQERLEYWQERLRLGNWRIQLVLVETHSLPLVPDREEVWGDVEVVPEMEAAIITLALHRPRRLIERTLVHELLHIVIAQMDMVHNQVLKTLGSEASALMWGHWDLASDRAIKLLAEAFVR